MPLSSEIYSNKGNCRKHFVSTPVYGILSFIPIKMSSIGKTAPSKRPLTVTLIALLYILAGVTGFIYHLSGPWSLEPEFVLILLIRLAAVAGGIFVWRGANWARWLLVVWIAYHVGLSFWHPRSELIMHAALLVITVYGLFQPNAVRYFRERKK
jgi:hypothetical protein